MNRVSHVAIVICVAASSCAGLSTRAREPSVAVLDESGVRSHEMTIEGGDSLTFVNTDGGPHQIYSSECPELDSRLLHAGETYRAVLGDGPKVCHFEDLVAPSKEAYAGTVQVRRSARDPIFDDAG